MPCGFDFIIKVFLFIRSYMIFQQQSCFDNIPQHEQMVLGDAEGLKNYAENQEDKMGSPSLLKTFSVTKSTAQ